MKTLIVYNGHTYTIDLTKPLDISIPVRGDAFSVKAWGLEHPEVGPHTDGDFVGKVSEGASVNFNDIHFNPHAHGTHTECVGHITKEFRSVNKSLERFFFLAELVSVTPEKRDGDEVISKAALEQALPSWATDILEQALKNAMPLHPQADPVPSSAQAFPPALIIRTLPNDESKLTRQWSGTNPPYLTEEAARFLADIGVEHLLIDTPSVDREKDEGRLLAHKAFWGVGDQRKPKVDRSADSQRTPRKAATITELVYVPDTIRDGSYFLNLQVAAFENDASPSRPVLYDIGETHPQ